MSADRGRRCAEEITSSITEGISSRRVWISDSRDWIVEA